MASKLTFQSKHKLLSGHEIPAIGFGVYMIPPSTTDKVVQEALKVGFRHVDSAIMYGNEKGCGAALNSSNLDRSEIFLTTKIPPGSMGYKSTKQAIARSLKDANTEYFDLILIHAPYGGQESRLGSWKALVEAQSAGQIRSIGVSNYGIHHLEELQSYIENGGGGEISVGQWELHPWLDHSDIADWCHERGIIVEAYSPLAHGERLDEPVLAAIGKKYGKSPAQVMIRWSLQMGFVPLAKSKTPRRITENADVFDFELDEEDMTRLDTGEYAPTDWDPTVDMD
ncbi:hypothetical protein N7478_009680 [Penicillium angulare]|uniref:uncharacterized protein n=1 Tax=Penicillium angulare TaxID=116970 RepID=UPI002540CFD2|nr:uncharacterized protein N7478_009680 [Penicillium angulare]KAJ5266872.1 hypothetical protein N7478_009680 [Penicillium angulare]